MTEQRKVFIGWGVSPEGGGNLVKCGEFDTVEEAEAAVMFSGLALAEIETEFRCITPASGPLPAQGKDMKASELEYAKRRALNLFDAWVDASGHIERHSSIYSEIQGCIEDAVDCGAQAAAGVYEKLPSEQ